MEAVAGQTMKALTVYQPWAALIMAGIKRIENRTRRVNYRGPLAIHAGRSRASMDVLRDSTIKELYEGVGELGECFGAVIGVVDLVDVFPIEDERVRDDAFAVGPWCWLLENPRKLAEPVEATGKLGLWDMRL